MDKELMYAFKVLLQQFQLAYPGDDELMDPESDLIVPCYWKAQLEAASSNVEVPTHSTATHAIDKRPSSNYHCWEYDISADLSDAIFEQFAVQSYTSFMKRTVRANCIESSCDEFESWITLHTGMTKYDVLRVEVASQDADIAWFNMRYYLMKLEKALDGYAGLAVPRYVVVGEKRHSLSPAIKSVRDSIMMGRDVKSLRTQMPWLPPDLDWFIIRAWRDISAFKELQMMQMVHSVRDKVHVLQKLVVKGDSQLLRMLSDLSGRCYHVPIEIEVPPAFLAKHGSAIKEGVSLLANVVSSSLSVPILQTAIDGAVSCLVAKTEQAKNVHSLIKRLDLTTQSGNTLKASTSSGLSPGGTMAILRDLLKLHNDSLDELSITEICNFECAATSKGDYVWAHIHEITMLKNELTPCQPRNVATTVPGKSSISEPHEEPSAKQTSNNDLKRASKLRVSLCIETVTELPDWDWYKTHCIWQLFYGGRKTPVATGATSTNADTTAQPSWRSLNTALDAVESVEMLQECHLAVQVKRRSRIGWTKLIGEGRVELRPLVSVDDKRTFSCDPIAVALQTNSSAVLDRVVHCTIRATN